MGAALRRGLPGQFARQAAIPYAEIGARLRASECLFDLVKVALITFFYAPDGDRTHPPFRHEAYLGLHGSEAILRFGWIHESVHDFKNGKT